MIPDISIGEIALGLVVAAALSGLVGLERELRERAAALRTHMLVGVGSALFDRLPPTKVTTEHKSRFELLRYGARKLDLSHVMSAGAMVVVAEADDTPLPFPMEVNGSPPAGTGTTWLAYATAYSA